jgi:hypothetical protein
MTEIHPHEGDRNWGTCRGESSGWGREIVAKVDGRPPNPGHGRISADAVARCVVAVFRVHDCTRRRWIFRGGTTTHGHEIAAAAAAAWAPASTMGFGFVGSTGPLIFKKSALAFPCPCLARFLSPAPAPRSRPFPLPKQGGKSGKTCRHRMGSVGVSRQKWPGGTARNGQDTIHDQKNGCATRVRAKGQWRAAQSPKFPLKLDESTSQTDHCCHHEQNVLL